ncbi:MAG: NusB antitermination factor [Pseudomonadota bacterium]|jgi:N utilization substance protein B
MGLKFNPRNAARALARRLAVQALYRWQINAGPWQDLLAEFSTDPDMPKADGEYFGALLRAAIDDHVQLDAALAPFLTMPPGGLDPVERAVLLVAACELRDHPDTPMRVVIAENVGIARRFGATDGHKLVNAVLDRAARAWRPDEP